MARPQRSVSTALVVVVVATSAPVDAIAVTRQAVWLAVGGLVLRVNPATGRALVVPEVDTGAPVVDLTAGAGAVWAVTSSAGLLRIDPGTARLTTPNPGPVSAVAAGPEGVWAVCCQGRGPRGRVTRSGCRPSRAAPSWPGRWWWPERRSGSPTRGVGWCGGSTYEAGPKTAGRPMGATSR